MLSSALSSWKADPSLSPCCDAGNAPVRGIDIARQDTTEIIIHLIRISPPVFMLPQEDLAFDGGLPKGRTCYLMFSQNVRSRNAAPNSPGSGMLQDHEQAAT